MSEHAPWSPSKADTAAQCPYRFYRQYVCKDRVPPNADALVGQAVHKALEYVLCGMPLDKAFEMVIKEFDVTTTEIDRILGFKPQAQNFKLKFSNYKKLITELCPM